MNEPTRRGLLSLAAGGLTFSSARGLLSMNPHAAAEPGVPKPAAALFPPIDAGRIAKRVVGATQPAAGEKAILVYDPGYYPELAQAIQAELLSAGVFPFLTIAFESPEIVEALDRVERPDPGKRQDQFVALLQPVFNAADLFYWLPAREIVGDRRLEHLQDASHARGIHFHWVLEPGETSGEDIAAASRMYERAILETDYAALSRRQDRMIAALRNRSLKLTSPDGTELTLHVSADAWFHKNDGDMSPARARQARGVRDREMEFPAGALRFIPDANAASGRLVVRRSPARGGPAEGVVFDFEEGRVRKLSATKNESGLRAMWEFFGGDIDRVGEIVLGVNPLLAPRLPSGDLPYAGYGEGYVRVSLGDNWESGGPLRCTLNRNLWLFLEGATLTADGVPVIQDGRLAVA